MVPGPPTRGNARAIGRGGEVAAVAAADRVPEVPAAEERLAGRLAAEAPREPARARSAAITVLTDVGRVDRALYRAVAGTPTPALDRPLRRLSEAANRSGLWMAIAAAMAAGGGRDGRRAAGA